MGKLHDLPTQLVINQTNVILGVVVVHNEEGMVQLRGGLAQQYQPLRVLLASSV
jgi:hypothetical protein